MHCQSIGEWNFNRFIKQLKKQAMKTLRIFGIAVLLCVFTGMVCNAQVADITIVVKEVREAKGKMMVAVGDKSNPQEMKYDMVEVKSTDDVVCILKEVPVGTCDVYVFQDLNDNYQLDKDENQSPIETCITKEKVKIKEGDNRIEVKLINVKEMMGK